MIQQLSDFAESPVSTLAESPSSQVPEDQRISVTLVNGNQLDLSELSTADLYQLQWEQETAFASKIKNSEKGSVERAQIIQQAYQTVCQILATASEKEGESEFAMGMDDRYTDFVAKRLASLNRKGISGGLFEVGFGSGLLLKSIADQGFEVGGLEVAPQLLADAKSRLPEQYHKNLCLGNFVQNDKVDACENRFSLVYWNDVFEHIPVDEIEDYLQKIYSILTPGGQLVTVTPNWHMRPMDVTADHLQPRSTAIGFHLKEYKLGEVCALLKNAGFKTVETPVFVGRRKIYSSRWFSLTTLKRLVEPALEWIPYSFAVQACRRFGLTITIASKPQ